MRRVVIVLLLALSSPVLPAAAHAASPASRPHRPGPMRAGRRAGALPAGLAAAIHRTLGTGPQPLSFQSVAGGFLSRNPLLGYDTHATPAGIRFTGLTGGRPWGMRLLGVGRAGMLNAVSAARLRTRGSELEYRRGDVTEWYRNTTRGVEQGFTLTRRPAGRSGRFSLALQLTGSVHVQVSGDGQTVRLTVPGWEPSLRYGELHVSDAAGHPVPAWLAVRGSTVLIEVTDRGAAYPLRIDPLVLGGQIEIKLGGDLTAPGDKFGFSVALSGDGKTAIVGRRGFNSFQGDAWIYVWNGASWVEQQQLLASDAATNDDFGWSVALSPDGYTAVVGAPIKNSSTGAAYVFTRSGTTWSQYHEMTASDGAAGDRFGIAVSVARHNGFQVLVGAPLKNSSTGAVYHYARGLLVTSSWSELKITASDGAAGDQFGASVAQSSDANTLLVGAPGKSTYIGGAMYATTGAAYAFVWNGSSFAQQQELTPSDGAAGDEFGASVSLSTDGNTALLGAPTKNSSTGAAYVSRRSSGSWLQQQELTASDGAAGDQFGTSVSVSSDGNTALIGAPYKNSSTGKAYVFTWNFTTWNQGRTFTAGDGAAGDDYGYAVALSGDTSTVMIGAPTTSAGGAAYMYILQPLYPLTGVSTTQYTLTNSDGATWVAMDSNNLRLTLNLPVASQVILSGNADLWTSSAGYNQDIGIWIGGGTFGVGSQPVAWKESGGFAGTYSPNAAYVQTVVSLAANTTYTVLLEWKANKADSGTIWAGAGPIGGQFSPTRLTAIVEPNADYAVASVGSTQQYQLAGSDGTTWQDLDATNLATSVTPGVVSTAILSGNADLWTSSAGYNQDIGIMVGGGSYGSGQLIAWKESGGFAGTYSPNAAFVQAVIPLSAGTTYTITLVWKANKSDPGTIWAGAGPIGGNFSPTRLTAVLEPAGAGIIASAVSTQQYTLTNNDGASWTNLDTASLSTTVTGSNTAPLAVVSGNADLWTSSAGYNQDIGIWVSGGSYGAGQVVAWKESGGFAGTFSPNAAFVETVLSLQAGTQYTIRLVWKANKADPGSIWAGAGPIGGQYSPTRLSVFFPPAE